MVCERLWFVKQLCATEETTLMQKLQRRSWAEPVGASEFVGISTPPRSSGAMQKRFRQGPDLKFRRQSKNTFWDSPERRTVWLNVQTHETLAEICQISGLRDANVSSIETSGGRTRPRASENYCVSISRHTLASTHPQLSSDPPAPAVSRNCRGNAPTIGQVLQSRPPSF